MKDDLSSSNGSKLNKIENKSDKTMGEKINQKNLDLMNDLETKPQEKQRSARAMWNDYLLQEGH